jgi:phosphoribosyl-ATP pyrophosphohydrolase
MQRFFDVLTRLSETIEARKGADPAASWTARLLADPNLCAKKVGEEAVETALAAVQHEPDKLAHESADLIYHWLVLIAGAGVSLDEVAAQLEAREAKSGIEEKRARLSE